MNLTKIRTALKECQFNPNAPGPMAVIADANNEAYWQLRALEQIKEIRNLPLTREEERERLVLSIRLLTLALVKHDEFDSQTKSPGS